MHRRTFILGAIATAIGIRQPAQAHGEYEAAIYDAAARYGTSGDWLVAVMYCESGGDPNAVGQYGEIGLFQYMPSTWYGWGGGDIWNPWEQIEMTAWAFANGLSHHWVCA